MLIIVCRRLSGDCDMTFAGTVPLSLRDVDAALLDRPTNFKGFCEEIPSYLAT